MSEERRDDTGRPTLLDRFLLRRRRPRTIDEVLGELGCSDDDITRAKADGTAELLAIDRLVLPEPAEYTIAELADRSGYPVGGVRAFWRALGFAEAGDDERAFTDRDVELLTRLRELFESGVADPERSLHMARVLGLSMARYADALVAVFEEGTAERRTGANGADIVDAESIVGRASEVLPMSSFALDYAFRRHLRAATRRRIMLASAAPNEGQCVGFADLVRFTALSHELDEDALARLVERFEETTNTIVVRHGGRIIKMIGDEAMFAVVDPVAAARTSLELAQTFGDHPDLPAIRVGLAKGTVLARDGDLYGPVVNLASRFVEFGAAGAVNVGVAMREALAGNPEFSVRSIGVRRLRHIGNVRVYRLRPGPAWDASAGG